MRVRILVTGQRDWPDKELVRQALLGAAAGFYTNEVQIVSGHCPTGVDAMAEEIAAEYGWDVDPNPEFWPQWERYGRAAGPVRNQKMVDSRPDFSVAFIGPGSRGTADCLKRIKKAKLPHTVFERSQCQSQSA